MGSTLSTLTKPRTPTKLITLNRFTLFPKLPGELQLLIWSHCVPTQPQVFHFVVKRNEDFFLIDPFQTRGNYESILNRMVDICARVIDQQAMLLALSHACSDSRKEVLKSYQFLRAGGPKLVNFERDVFMDWPWRRQECVRSYNPVQNILWMPNMGGGGGGDIWALGYQIARFPQVRNIYMVGFEEKLVPPDSSITATEKMERSNKLVDDILALWVNMRKEWRMEERPRFHYLTILEFTARVMPSTKGSHRKRILYQS